LLLITASSAASRLLSEIMLLDTALPAPFHVIAPDWFNAIAFILAAVIVEIATRGRLGYRQNVTIRTWLCRSRMQGKLGFARLWKHAFPDNFSHTKFQTIQRIFRKFEL